MGTFHSKFEQLIHTKRLRQSVSYAKQQALDSLVALKAGAGEDYVTAVFLHKGRPLPRSVRRGLIARRAHYPCSASRRLPNQGPGSPQRPIVASCQLKNE